MSQATQEIFYKEVTFFDLWSSNVRSLRGCEEFGLFAVPFSVESECFLNLGILTQNDCRAIGWK